MSIIKAPYNFVPLSKIVVQPYWTKFINHDLPFEDAESGILEVTLTAESPIFVKNGSKKKENDFYVNEKKEQIKPYDFNQFKNKYFIPGSSLKGMIRSVLEVMSFGRMDNRVNDDRYALRDLSSAMKDEYLKTFKPDIIKCGWLRKNDDNTYTLEDCNFPGRISHQQLNEDLEASFNSYFTPSGGFRGNNDYEKSAQKKYDLFGNKEREHRYSLAPNQDTTGRKKFVINKEGEVGGQLVFTGQPGPRKQMHNGRWTGHHLEFIFFDKVRDVIVDEKVMENFFFAYYEQDKTKWSEDWKVWRKKLSAKEPIPVFFQTTKDSVIKHIGLSYLYKLPYNNSVKESIDQHQKETGFDLAEAIFGHTDKEQGALKGRVHFGHAFASNTPQVDESQLEVLAGPKASYYPNYMRQEVKNGKVNRYSTFMDKTAEIAGWKRYPIHKEGVQKNPPPLINGIRNTKIGTQFISLKKGAEFKFKIRYHNLKKIELGALISALTFHNTEGTFHSLGMAKPLGYGKTKLEVTGVENINDYLCAFESYMNVNLKNDSPEWTISPQMKELVAMVSEQENKGASELKYMKLQEFVDAKKRGSNEALDRYSNLVTSTKMIKPICTPEEIEAMKKQCENEAALLSKFTSVEEQVKKDIIIQENNLVQLFEEKKRTLIRELKERRIELEEKERKEKQDRLEQEIASRKESVKQQGLEKYIEGKKTKVIKDLKNLVEQYGEVNCGCRRKDLTTNYPNGYLSDPADAKVIENWLIETYTSGGKKIKNEFEKPFGKNHPIFKEVIKWIGEGKANIFYNQIIKL
jgi:CRISPR-associated protein (TIGR03986 family)